ncbi:MAG TPA: hypothetical protein VGE74_04025 [Gemmata sp.]
MSTPKNAPAKVDDPAKALAELVKDFGPGALKTLDDVSRAFKIAEGVTKIREVINGAVDRIRPLAGSPLGFRTDKDSTGGYPPAVLVDCATEALLRGLRLTGNEWNIIGGRCYVAQAGFARLVAELDGLTDLELSPGVPVLKEGGALVEYSAKWRIDGKPMSVTRTIPIRVNNGMGADAILGKAKRKILAAVYERVTGSALSEGEADDVPLAPAAPPKTNQLLARAEEVRAKLANKAAPADPWPAAAGPDENVQLDEHGNPVFASDLAGALFGNPAKTTGGNLPD